ncbi:4-(cytidine 5'-diphospho)-2-C-methyl-D-erythritol kinase [Microbacterium sp. zg.B48]|uniref:4-(cytidine 5'-diphospho)-2-C-methyl-D-erythritol kinase n=1 Tax=unclassified Microbacterium TaxID=2609290 RepID=UPI00214A9E95|nr:MULTISPECIES: 4-(cytidine 5'-diphospho)-2-C-methyl-D-erythritol kinase [unclassified Microbacterium]MCR2762349.1 4-(cytidine 5'-diphospho)-2-C-methyl-D-erythritol kinase [Microbacterium sp. zg.B48]MCR2809645.1 4-(cytidine 5'-diphospho)-2-C-methyl-D-erythritol kinase [Microbacterium sp. zg.B185]WIM18031.1 4-(cytidine 5'-diphospho)-2-C-methyl-D-erythritol kinase [Microbacterium sp. zg-B185]
MSSPAATGRVHARAPGKLNLFFEVGDAQEDGYHEVASAYQAVSLYEDVWAESAEDFSVTVSGTVDLSGVPADDRNLALRAARLVAQKIGYAGGVHLEIVKHVPVAGGMGGGSADAAAALVACDALWGADLGTAQLHQLAARLGADVPFALMGGTAIGTGRGDQLSPALAKGRFDWVVVPADAGLSTPEVYAHLDVLRMNPDVLRAPRTPAVPPGVLQALRAGDPVSLAERARNDLQTAALSLRPPLRDALELGEEAGALVGLVSGSGPTLAFLASDPESALELQVVLSAAGYRALHVHGPVHGARLA